MSDDVVSHVLVFPYPAQGHMIPILDFTHQLALRRVAVTVVVTPKNVPLLDHLISSHPSLVKTLVFPLPSVPSNPAGIENVKDLPPRGFVSMMPALGLLHDPLLQWFRTHPSPPVAIVSDMFLGWTHRLADRLGIRRFMFYASSAMTLSFTNSLWLHLPKKKDRTDDNELISFPDIPNSLTYPWWQVSPVFRRYVQGDPDSEFIRDGFLANAESWGVVINSSVGMEGVYFDYLKKTFGHDRFWTVGPLLPDPSGNTERGGSSSASADEISSWLDACDDRTVVYVCFGSQAVLTNEQMEKVASGLEESRVKFVWSVKGAIDGQGADRYGTIPEGFEDRVAGRGQVIRGWAPQVMILRHRAVGGFLSHCGWNSVLEAMVAGVPVLAWPMSADQFLNATLLVEELKVAIRVCEGGGTMPESSELGRILAEAMDPKEGLGLRTRAMGMRDRMLDSIGESSHSLDDFVDHLRRRLAGD